MIEKLFNSFARFFSRTFERGPRLIVVCTKEEASEIRGFMRETKLHASYEILKKMVDPRKFANYGGDQLVLISDMMKDDLLTHVITKLAKHWEFGVYTFSDMPDFRNQVADFIKES